MEIATRESRRERFASSGGTTIGRSVRPRRSFLVRYGRQQLGSVDRMPFTLRHDKPSVLFLAGHAWIVNHIDSRTRTVFVEPTADEGKSRWLGRGQPLSFELCQTIKRILVGDNPRVRAVETRQRRNRSRHHRQQPPSSNRVQEPRPGGEKGERLRR